MVVDARLEGEAEVVSKVVADAHLGADRELPGAFVLLPCAEAGAEAALGCGTSAGEERECAVLHETPASVERKAEVLDALFASAGCGDDLRRESSPDKATFKDETFDGLKGNSEAEAVLGVVVENVA